MTSMRFSSELEDLQRRLYQDARRDLGALAELHSPAISEYERSFEQSLPHKPTTISRRSLIKAILSSKICLIGDFHTLRQSQREALRILRECLSAQTGEHLYFAMECFRSADQKYLDLYSAGKIEIEEVFASTKFEQYWGFPNQNYQMLIEFCRHHAIPIRGINTENAGKDSIRKRDDHCAEILSDILVQDPAAKILLLIGEYHLADDKLPAAIKRKSLENHKSVVRILTNTDRYFDSVTGAFSSFSSVHLKLDRNFYSILNTSPWLKWMSALHWEETRQSSDLSDYIEEDSDEDFNVFDFDFDHFFLHITKQTASLLRIDLGESLLSHFTIVNLGEISDFSSFARENELSPKLAKQLRLYSEIFGAFVSDDSRTIFLKNYSFSSLASAVGQFLTMVRQTNSPTDSRRRELSLLVGQISSKILNPKLKIKSLQDIGSRRFRYFIKLFMSSNQSPATRPADAVALSEVIECLTDLVLHQALRSRSGEKLFLEFIEMIDTPSLALNKIIKHALDQLRGSRSISGAGTKKAS